MVSRGGRGGSRALLVPLSLSLEPVSLRDAPLPRPAGSSQGQLPPAQRSVGSTGVAEPEVRLGDAGVQNRGPLLKPSSVPPAGTAWCSTASASVLCHNRREVIVTEQTGERQKLIVLIISIITL